MTGKLQGGNEGAGHTSLTLLYLSAWTGTLKSGGCCGSSPTSPRPITAKVSALMLRCLLLKQLFNKKKSVVERGNA